MSWIKKFSSAEESEQMKRELIMELVTLEHDASFNPNRIYSLRAFRNETGIYVDAAGTKEQLAILNKLGYEWSESEHSTRDMELVFEHSEDN